MKINIKRKIEKGDYDVEILLALAHGMTYDEIKESTGLNKNYVSYAINLLHKKFHTKSNTQLVILALQKNIIDIESIPD